jgi:hypothetical protein
MNVVYVTLYAHSCTCLCTARTHNVRTALADPWSFQQMHVCSYYAGRSVQSQCKCICAYIYAYTTTHSAEAWSGACPSNKKQAGGLSSIGADSWKKLGLARTIYIQYFSQGVYQIYGSVEWCLP